MAWKFTKDTPIYMQLLERIKVSIANGTYPPGTKLPAVRDLALEAGVNPNTVQRTFAELEREGLAASDRTNGRYVLDDEERIRELREELSGIYIEELFHSLKELGMDEEEIMNRISLRKENHGDIGM